METNKESPESRLKRLREDAEFSIGAGVMSATKGPVQIASADILSNNTNSVLLAHFLRREDGTTSLAVVAVWIPQVMDDRDNKKLLRREKSGDTAPNRKK